MVQRFFEQVAVQGLLATNALPHHPTSRESVSKKSLAQTLGECVQNIATVFDGARSSLLNSTKMYMW